MCSLRHRANTNSCGAGDQFLLEVHLIITSILSPFYLSLSVISTTSNMSTSGHEEYITFFKICNGYQLSQVCVLYLFSFSSLSLSLPYVSFPFSSCNLQVLFVIAKLGIADLLKDGPKTAEELARETKTIEENLGRLLRAAAANDIIFRDPETLKYSLSPLSKLLLGIISPSLPLSLSPLSPSSLSHSIASDGPESFRYIALHIIEPPTVKAWLHLEKTMYDGSYGYEVANGGLFSFPFFFFSLSFLFFFFIIFFVSFSFHFRSIFVPFSFHFRFIFVSFSCPLPFHVRLFINILFY
jgi:Dimerisation domain